MAYIKKNKLISENLVLFYFSKHYLYELLQFVFEICFHFFSYFKLIANALADFCFFFVLYYIYLSFYCLIWKWIQTLWFVNSDWLNFDVWSSFFTHPFYSFQIYYVSVVFFFLYLCFFNFAHFLLLSYIFYYCPIFIVVNIYLKDVLYMWPIELRDKTTFQFQELLLIFLYCKRERLGHFQNHSW